MVVEKKYDNYDHGFVDINEYNICGENFKYEKEILFNALNVYKVISKKN